MEGLQQPIINGLLLGGLYAIIAVGMSTIFGIVKLVNLAHGDLIIMSSYLSLALVTWLGVSPLVTLFMVVPAMFFVGFFIQGGLLNRVLGKEMEPPLLVTFGISIILQNVLLLIFTPDARSLMSSLALKTIPLSETVSLPVLSLINFMTSAIVIFAVHLFFRNTYLGRAIRAASDNEMCTRLMGVNTKRIYAYAMGIALMTAAIAGVLIGMSFTFYPHSGPQFLIISFGVIIIGGLGSMKGCFAGGLILALAQMLGAHFAGIGYQLFFGYAVLLVVLGIKPKGLFGKV